MIRERLAEKGVGRQAGFRWRGEAVSRIEGLSDAVFGFAIALLIVRTEVPGSFAELSRAMLGFFGFAVCFVFLMAIWYEHYKFFRRYGLQDAPTIVLNAVLLFVVLFYLYPLKFLFTALINAVLGIPGGPAIRTDDAATLMIVYGLGFLAVALVFVLLYLRAYRRRAALALDALEVFDTKMSMGAAGIYALSGAISVAIVVTGGPEWAAAAGWSYGVVLSPGFAIFYTLGYRRRARLEASLAGAAAAGSK